LLTPNDVKAIVDVADNLRDRALIMCLYESACRAEEILGLRNRNVQFDKYGAVIVVKGKTGMRRIRLIDSVPDLTAWMNMHPQKKPDSPLFINLGKKGYGDPLGYDGLNRLVKKLAKRAGIDKRVHPHLFRHSRITEWAKDDFTESDMKVMAGWTGSSQMPAIYVHLSGADVDKKVLARHGLIEEKEKIEERPLTPKKCPRCETKNPSTAKFCNKCSAVLDVKAAIKLQERVEGMEKLTIKDHLLSRMLEDEEIKTVTAKWLLEHGPKVVLSEMLQGTHWATIIDELAPDLSSGTKKRKVDG
ncbi:MAG: site-specific integrase, partial [Methanocellales archaeon]|nr:site-specific integrase [Methanocellales archaeon]